MTKLKSSARPMMCLLILLTLPSIVSAQDNTTTTSIEIHATFNNVGVQVNIIGDNNNNAIATMEANINGLGFVPVHNLSKVFLVVTPPTTYPQRFVGSVFSLTPETTVDVRVTISDPDGVTNSVQTASIITRSKQIPASSGSTLHVSTNGNDITGNGSSINPYASIQQAVDLLSIGGTVLVHAGIYHEDIEFSDNIVNTNQAYSTIKSAGDGEVILDGTDFSLNNPNAWVSVGNNVYRAALNSPNNESYYVGFDGNRMWKYFSLPDLQGLIYNTDGGFYSDALTNQIYVKFPGNATPVGHQITVSNLHNAMTMFNVNNIVIDGLTFNNFNSGEHSNAIHVTDNSNNIWIINSIFKHMETAIRLEAAVTNLVVMNNEFSDQGVLAFNWDIVKDHQHWLERGALYCSNDEYSGYGTIFTNNYAHEMFDGVKIVGQETLTFASNSDVHNNTFFNLADDGIETDGYSSNVRIHNNRFEKMLIGVSVAPALAGPTYINRNLMVDLQNIAGTDYATGAVKFSIGDEIYGDIFIYHNTGSTTEFNREAFSVSNEADWTHLVMKNNIWSGTSYGIYYFLDNAASLDFIQDYDLLFATSGFAAQYQGEDYADIIDYFTASNVCQNCQEGNPNFVSQALGNYHINSNSPAINNATLIAGINALDGNGNLPDIGRYEFQTDLIFENNFE